MENENNRERENHTGEVRIYYDISVLSGRTENCSLFSFLIIISIYQFYFIA